MRFRFAPKATVGHQAAIPSLSANRVTDEPHRSSACVRSAAKPDLEHVPPELNLRGFPWGD
jgi:hypothetical protein